jgi:hypothetical protein
MPCRRTWWAERVTEPDGDADILGGAGETGDPVEVCCCALLFWACLSVNSLAVAPGGSRAGRQSRREAVAPAPRSWVQPGC